MSEGNANDDEYRGIHIFYQADHKQYPLEVQVNMFYDRQMNNWLHKYLYKKEYVNEVRLQLRKLYENGRIINETMFKGVLAHVLSCGERV